MDAAATTGGATDFDPKELRHRNMNPDKFKSVINIKTYRLLEELSQKKFEFKVCQRLSSS